jgi:hypothetical protein
MMSAMSALKSMLMNAAGGAAAAAGLWWMVNRAVQINNQGWLERLEWPINSQITITLAGALFGLVRGYFKHRKDEQLKVELAEVSESADMELEEKPAEVEHPPMPLFENMYSITNRMTGEQSGLPVQVFDLTTTVKSDDGDSWYTRTIVLLPAEGLPHFTLIERTVGYRLLSFLGSDGVTFDPAAAPPEDRDAVERFARFFVLCPGELKDLSGGEPEKFDELDAAARQVFTLNVIKAFADQPGWSVESHSGHLAFWRGKDARSAAQRVAMVPLALKLREVLFQSDPKAVLPRKPGTDRERQAARIQGGLLGGVIGMFVSFFTAGIVVSSLVFNRQPGEMGFPFEMLLFPVIMVVGVTLSVMIGSRMKKPIRKPKDKRYERGVGCGILFGLFGGFLGGGAAGAIISESFGLPIGAHTIRIALFFGGAMFGAIGGACGFGWLVSKLMPRRDDPAADANDDKS